MTGRCARDGEFRVGVKHAVETGRRQHQRPFDGFAKNPGRRGYSRHVVKDFGDKLIFRKCGNVASKADLVIGAAINIIEDRTRQPPAGQDAQISNIVGAREGFHG
jgi:hypothetical protein